MCVDYDRLSKQLYLYISIIDNASQQELGMKWLEKWCGKIMCAV